MRQGSREQGSRGQGAGEMKEMKGQGDKEINKTPNS